MNFYSRASLRQMLTIPYVLLVLLAATVIGILSYNAGRDVVDTLSDHVLRETVNRITQAVDKHISGSEAVLETAFPSDVHPPLSVKDDLDALRTRFWLATSIHRDPNNYVYYGNRRGQFIGLWRFSETEAELRLRTDGVSPRSIYHYSRIHGELTNPETEARLFEPRERPWYEAGQDTTKQTWTSIYIDFKTLQLVTTRARRVNNDTGEFEGVVATDLSMELLNGFLKELELTPNGFAFIVESDGNLVAASRGPHLRKDENGANIRLSAMESGNPWIAQTYKVVKALTEHGDAPTGTRTSSFTGPNGAIIQAGYARLRDAAGLDWIVAVAVPRSDFMQKVTENVRQTVVMAIVACILIALIGFMTLNIIAKGLRQLAVAAKEIGEGVLDAKIPLDRNDEIGELAKSFATMQKHLLTDRLTGIPNREAIVRRIEDRIIRQRRRGDTHPFAVLFVDLNGFKQINDQFGHDTGDRVLKNIAQRLKMTLRESDLAARFGGDEFIVLLNEVANRNDAIAVRNELESVLSTTPMQSLVDMETSEATFTVSASIGIALCPEDGRDLETLLKRADEDMYLRKHRKTEETEPENLI
ncbi:MAG: diguanylate cyclase [Gammaproteobacteria bacterium]|nr:diguanylate cyclase [Gammaproteobacteria bacterium]MCP4980296.1 diguanylate cyclase [Gammaproteobacteria bacterium]